MPPGVNRTPLYKKPCTNNSNINIVANSTRGMSNTHSVSISDDDLNEWFEQVSEEVFNGKSATVVKALKVLKSEKGDEIDSLMDIDDRDVLV